MSNTFLEDAIDRLSMVPQDVKRCMELVRDLDTRWAKAMTTLKAAQDAYLDRVRKKVRWQPWGMAAVT
jgi:hypothetical protein